jgi:hypothetical protein
MNVFYLPFLMPIFYSKIPDIVTRLFLFPFLTWTIEIIEGYTLICACGFNPAWKYTGSDAYFHGNIQLSYFGSWFITGIMAEGLLHEILLKHYFL